jgi:hypothetical protein
VLALSLSAAVAQAQKQKSKVLPIVTLYSKYTRALTFQNLCDSPCERPFFFLRRADLYSYAHQGIRCTHFRNCHDDAAVPVHLVVVPHLPSPSLPWAGALFLFLFNSFNFILFHFYLPHFPSRGLARGLGLWFAIKKKYINNKTLGTGLARSWSLFKKQKSLN